MNTASILWGLVFGSIGFAYFIYGKKQGNIVSRYTGVALMIVPYFFEDVIFMCVVGVGLLLVPRFIKL